MKKILISILSLVFLFCLACGATLNASASESQNSEIFTETKCQISKNGERMLIVTGIKSTDLIYELGYEINGEYVKQEGDIAETDKYYQSLTLGITTKTASEMFADAKDLLIWEVAYDKTVEYTVRPYAYLGELNGEGQLIAPDNNTKTFGAEKANFNAFTVTFELNGEEYLTVDANYGETVTAPNVEVEDGYTFDGWYLGETKYDFAQSVKGNLTLTATYVVNPDDSDVEAVKHMRPEGGTKWPGSMTTAEIVGYSELANISKPDGVEGNTLIKYVHTCSTSTNVNSVPLRFSSGKWDYAFDAQESALDFSKAELTFMVYNPNTISLPVYFGYNIGAYLNAYNYGSTTVPANSWTKVIVDLSLYNIDITAPYDVVMFIGAFNYTGELVYYIDNVSVHEKEVVDANDEEAIKHLVDQTPITAQGNHGIITSAEVISYKNSGITKPDGVVGDSLVKYTVTARTGDTGSRFWSSPLRYNSTKPLTEEQKQMSFSKMVIKFNIYNPNNVNIPVYLKNNIASYAPAGALGTASAKANSWTTVSFALSSMGLTDGGSYDIVITVGGENYTYTTMNYYLDEVTIYEIDADDAAALVHMRPEGGAKYGAVSTTVAEVIGYAESGLSKPNESVQGSSLIKYVHTNTNVDANTGKALLNSLPLRFTNGAEQAFDETEKQLDFTKAVLSFYIYNPNSFNFTVYATKGVWAYFTANHGSVVATAGEWTLVEFELAPYAIDVNGSYDVTIGIGGEDFAASTITYYLDNVQFYVPVA